MRFVEIYEKISHPSAKTDVIEQKVEEFEKEKEESEDIYRKNKRERHWKKFKKKDKTKISFFYSTNIYLNSMEIINK